MGNKPGLDFADADGKIHFQCLMARDSTPFEVVYGKKEPSKRHLTIPRVEPLVVWVSR